jgi:hypothetical protein
MENEDITDQPVTWSHTIGTRDGTLTTDAKMVNCYVENIDGSGPAIVKRPGTMYFPTDGGLVTGAAQGQFAGPNGNYYIVNNTIYPAGDFTPGTGTAIPSPDANNTAYFTIGTFQANIPLITLQDVFGSLWTFNGTTITKVTDTNYISSLVNQGMAYLDGVWYAMRANGQVIGSAINDPTTWPALDFVQADVTYGNGIACQRHLNYVLAFYDQGLQVYWDADAAPNGEGIALNPVLNASFRTGCYASQTIVELCDNCFWMSNTYQYGRQIQMMTGLQMQPISTPWVERVLNSAVLSPIALDDIWAFGLELAGHQLYCLTLPNSNVTLVYDVGTQVWGTWSSVVGGVEQYFTGRFSIKAPYNVVTGAALNTDTLQDVSTGRPMLMLATNYTDATGPMNVTCVTPPYDWKTSNYKRFNYMTQLADSINTSISVSYTDNDYQSFSTPRVMGLMGPRNQLRNCGSSRRRAWKMFHQDNTPLRLYEVRMDMDILAR